MDQHCSGLWLIKTEQQPQYRTLSGPSTPGERHLFPVHDRKAQVLQHRMLIISKCHIFKFHKWKRCPVCIHLLHLPRRILCPFLQRKKLIDPVNPCDRRLNRLNLHAKTFHRCENLRNIINDRHGCSG